MYEYNNQSLTFIERNDHELKIKKLNYWIIILSLVILSLFYANYLAYSMLGEYQKKEHQMEVLVDSVQKMNLKTVDEYIESLPFKNKNLIKKQYRLESSYLKSSLVRTNMNLFGIKNASKRAQIGRKSKYNDYRHYDNWQMSVLDRLLYEVKYGTSLAGYAEDSLYFKKLQNVKI
jgi:tetrahydromethanopterin S-methyltransferase subunit F